MSRNKSAVTEPMAKSVDLSALEPIVDLLLSGVATAKEIKDVAKRLEALGQPATFDQTEQLRLALRLLECHDDSVTTSKKRQKPARPPEAGLA